MPDRLNATELSADEFRDSLRKQLGLVPLGLQRLGPEWGYYPEPAKSIFICSPEDWQGAEELLEAFSFKFIDGYRYVGGFLGSDAALSQWLAPQIQQWVSGVTSLAKVAKRYPQTTFAGLPKSLQQEWQYLQCAVPGMVLLCHNDVATKWHHLCAQALTPSAVSDKP
jgi:hypothetical protein